MNENKLVVAKSEWAGNVYYLFRENGQEIELKVSDSRLISGSPLLPGEREGLNKMFGTKDKF